MLELRPGYRLGRWREPTEAMEDEAGEKARDEDVVMEVVADVRLWGVPGRKPGQGRRS